MEFHFVRNVQSTSWNFFLEFDCHLLRFSVVTAADISWLAFFFMSWRITKAAKKMGRIRQLCKSWRPPFSDVETHARPDFVFFMIYSKIATVWQTENVSKIVKFQCYTLHKGAGAYLNLSKAKVGDNFKGLIAHLAKDSLLIVSCIRSQFK